MTTHQPPAFRHHPKDLVLDYYHCTFFLPLSNLASSKLVEDGFEPKEAFRQFYSHTTNHELKAGEAQAYHFFTPSIRNILYDSEENTGNLQAVKEWRLPHDLIKDWELHLGDKKDKNNPTQYQQSNIKSVKLYQYFNEIYILAIQVEPMALIELRKQENCLLFDYDAPNSLAEIISQDSKNEKFYHQLAMENWLQFTRLARLLYPTFRQQTEENKIASIQLIRPNRNTETAFNFEVNQMAIKENSGDNFSPIITAILKSFTPKPQNIAPLFKNYKGLHDDRLFVSVAYGIAGKKLPDESLVRINSLVSHVDRQEDGWDDMQGYVYTPEIIQERIKKQAFRLWEGIGSYYTFTDFSNTYLSRGKDFRTFIASEHIPYIYDRMLIQALFYQASLRLYDEQICNETKDLLENSKQGVASIRQQRQEFIRFTNQYWFHKLTEQMQGKEIFTLQQQGLGVQEHYAILKDELERTDEYLQTEHESRLSKITDNFTLYGIMVAVIAAYYSILPMINDAIKDETQTLWTKYSSGNAFVGLSIFLIIVPVIIALGVWCWKKPKDHDKS